MKHPEIFQIIEKADKMIDQLGEEFESNYHPQVNKTITNLVFMVEQIQKLVGEEIPPDDVNKPLLLETIDLAFSVIAEVKGAVDDKNQNEFNAKLHLLSLALDDMVEIIIAEGRTPD